LGSYGAVLVGRRVLLRLHWSRRSTHFDACELQLGGSVRTKGVRKRKIDLNEGFLLISAGNQNLNVRDLTDLMTSFYCLYFPQSGKVTVKVNVIYYGNLFKKQMLKSL
jgi:hypothetical protein